MKATLVIHPHFRSYIFNPLTETRLKYTFSAIYVCDRIPTREATALLVYGETTILKKSLFLENYYRRTGSCKTDTVIEDYASTSYKLPSYGARMYSIRDKAPRFLLWLDDGACEPNVCCTALYACSEIAQLPAGVAAATRWAQKYVNAPTCGLRNLNVVVFDLDQTLIDGNPADCKPLKNYDRVLQTAREHYDLVVLWSHGSSLHVNAYAARLNFNFDLILNKDERTDAADDSDTQNCKNLLNIYNYISTDCRIGYAVLVDDSPYNWTPEYDALLVPIRGITDILPLSHVLYKLKV